MYSNDIKIDPFRHYFIPENRLKLKRKKRRKTKNEYLKTSLYLRNIKTIRF